MQLSNSNRHHLLFERYAWEARQEARCLRRSSGLIVRLAQDNHTALHNACTSVPVPNIYMLRGIQRTFIPSGDIFQAVDNFCFAVEEARSHPKAHELDKRLGEIMIESVRCQLPYIEVEHGAQ